MQTSAVRCQPGAAQVHKWIKHFVLRHKLCPYAAQSLPSFEIFESWERNPIPGALQLCEEIAAAQGPLCISDGQCTGQEPDRGAAAATQPKYLSNFMLLLRHRSFRQFGAFDAASSSISQQLHSRGAAYNLAFFHPKFPQHGNSPTNIHNDTDVYVARAPMAIWHFLPVDQLLAIQADPAAPSGTAGKHTPHTHRSTFKDKHWLAVQLLGVIQRISSGWACVRCNRATWRQRESGDGMRRITMTLLESVRLLHTHMTPKRQHPIWCLRHA